MAERSACNSMAAPDMPWAKAIRYEAHWQVILATLLRLAGWLTINALASLGLPLALAFAIGSFSVGGTMHHLLNLAGRYVVAGHVRQAQFDLILTWTVVGTFAVVGLCRRHSLKQLVMQEVNRDR